MGLAYKMFRVSRQNKGSVFPLYVNADKPTPIGEWIKAECGELKDGKVKSRLGLLAYRPGWHLSELPIATHMGVKDEQGKIAYLRSNSIWAVCEYSDNINYQPEADLRGYVNGRYDRRKAYLDYIPEDGYYRYKTNPMMLGDWILAGKIRINHILNDAEVEDILLSHNIQPMKRQGGAICLADYGF